MDYTDAYNSRKNKCGYCRKRYDQDPTTHQLDCTEVCFEDELSLEDFISIQLEREAVSNFEQSSYGKQLQKQCKDLLYNYYAAHHNYNVECERYIEQYRRMRQQNITK